ncbi:MAG: hypothetical protein M5U09_02680, partial [Gammaproteobacteria bacterium]|nr:hypothetical protein [Gammaproteobacteria bacterium]
VSGRDGATTIIHAPNGSRDTEFGYAIAGGVDVTGDDVPDLLGSGGGNTRVVHVYSGATLEIVNTIPETRRFSLFGVRVEFADVNGDGDFERSSARWAAFTSMNRSPAVPSSGIPSASAQATGMATSSAPAFNGDHFTDLFAPLRSGEVALYGGPPLC